MRGRERTVSPAPDESMNDSSADRRLVTRVRIHNYRNIAACDVVLTQLSLVIGANGVGKSNFLDAVGLIGDCLRSSLGDALRRCGGAREIVRRTSGRAEYFGIRLDYSLGVARGHYAVALGADRDGKLDIRREECRLASRTETHFCALERGRVTECTFPHPPPVPKSDLYLMRLAAVPEFRPAYEALSKVCVYGLDPAAIRELHEPEQGPLRADGRNVASVLEAIKRRSPTTKERLDQYLQAVVPDLAAVDKLALGPWRTLAFRKVVHEGTRHRCFLARDMSDGTLRIVGLLAALLQGSGANASHHGLVCIEEPETALHPGALEVLWDMLADGAERTQVLVASQSADLLDHKQVPMGSIVAVASDGGGVRLGPIDEAGRSVIENGNFTAGELMRMEQLLPDEKASRLRPSQVSLFGASASR